MFDGMTLRIDKAERIVVPKPLRERLGLRAGIDLEVRESSQGLLLKTSQSAAVSDEGRAFSDTHGQLPKHRAYMSAHSLAEVYSVLTRAPFTPRIYPGEAWQMIEHNFLPHLKIVPLSAREYREIVKRCRWWLVWRSRL